MTISQRVSHRATMGALPELGIPITTKIRFILRGNSSRPPCVVRTFVVYVMSVKAIFLVFCSEVNSSRSLSIDVKLIMGSD